MPVSLGTPCAINLVMSKEKCPLTRSVCLSPPCFPAQRPRHVSQVCRPQHIGQLRRWQHQVLGPWDRAGDSRGSAWGFTFPEQSGAQKQRVGGYVVAAEGQTLVIHKAPEDKAPEDKVETAADGKAGTETPVAFFQCASNIAAFDVAGANVAVCCAGNHHAGGQVLQLRAAVLLT